MVKSFLFVARLVLAWYLLFLVVFLLLDSFWWPLGELVTLVGFVAILVVIVRAYSHLRRVRMISGQVDSTTLGNRQQRQIEVPFEAHEAYDLLHAAVREFPRAEQIESARDSLQVRARIKRLDASGGATIRGHDLLDWFVSQHNRIVATVTPGDGSSRISLTCEPELDAWSDWFRVDDGVNLENAEAITRAITRRVAERRRSEQTTTAQTVTEKELAIAKLNLLNAQVEPHFLYNTLANAQYLTRSDPASADSMLGHLIAYLRHSLPRTDHALSTLGEELERSRAYLEILKVRMGTRLKLQIDVPDALLATPLPPMMLQTLVENAIKHGLEPKPGGGTVWIIARRDDSLVAVTVADDGRGFNPEISGTGIGLKNVRERLRLIYGPAAALAIVANLPDGVAATISVPAAVEKDASHG